MVFLRDIFPLQSITPKLHLLEDHAVNFVSAWGTGLGFYGEQGAESIHAEFNGIARLYHAVKPETNRLLLMTKEHYLRCNPVGQGMVLVPPATSLLPLQKNSQCRKPRVL